MEAPNLYNKVRPSSFAEVVGQPDAVRLLEGQISRPASKRSHAILLSGPSGCGKTTLARIFKEEMGCGDADYQELDAAKARGIDDMRAMLARVTLRPLGGRCRIWLIDEAHQLTTDAQTAVLKTLEDTPHHAYFILCTTHPQKVIPTVKTRCLEVVVKAIALKELVALVKRTAASEEMEISDEVIGRIAEVANGSARRAIVLLDSIREIPDEEDQLTALAAGDCRTKAIEIARALCNPKTTWPEMAKILKDLEDEDPEGIRYLVLAYCQTILLSGKQSPRIFSVMCEFQKNFYDSKKAGLTLACYSVIVP